MANIRVKDLPNTDTLVDGDELIVDSTAAGTRRISFGELKSETASDFVAAPSTYKVATLAADNKLDPSQIPDTLTNGLNFVGVANSDPDLVSTTQGDFYVIGTAFGVYSVGDQAVYDGSAYVRVTDGTKQIGEGGTGATTAAGARTNLSVNSKDEDAQANGTKVTAPALRFDGTSSVVTVADDDKLSFTDGNDDLPFTVSAWIKSDDLSVEVPIITKYGVGKEFLFYVQDSDLVLALWDGTNDIAARTTSAITGYNGQWIHVAATYAGSGPNSDNAFTAAADGITLYINGVSQTITATNDASYTGIANTSEVLRLGARAGVFGESHLRDAKIFNRELTASEIAELARGNDLGFADEFGGALGDTYTSNFTGSANGWTAVNGNIAHSTSVGGESNALRLILDGTTGGHYLQKTGVFTRGKRYRIKGRYYVPTNSHVDGIYFAIGTAGPVEVVRESAATLDSWIDFSVEVVANATADTDRLLVYAMDGNSNTVTDPGANDVFYILDLVITQIGTLADFRAEDYNESASKLLDRSSNNFVGIGTSVTLTGNQRHISADTIDLKNLPTSSAGLSAGEVWSNGGVLTVV